MNTINITMSGQNWKPIKISISKILHLLIFLDISLHKHTPFSVKGGQTHSQHKVKLIIPRDGSQHSSTNNDSQQYRSGAYRNQCNRKLDPPLAAVRQPDQVRQCPRYCWC